VDGGCFITAQTLHRKSKPNTSANPPVSPTSMANLGQTCIVTPAHRTTRSNLGEPYQKLHQPLVALYGGFLNLLRTDLSHPTTTPLLSSNMLSMTITEGWSALSSTRSYNQRGQRKLSGIPVKLLAPHRLVRERYGILSIRLLGVSNIVVLPVSAGPVVRPGHWSIWLTFPDGIWTLELDSQVVESLYPNGDVGLEIIDHPPRAFRRTYPCPRVRYPCIFHRNWYLRLYRSGLPSGST